MAGIFRNRKIFYRTADDPSLSPNRFASVGLLETLRGTFEVTEHEGDTLPEPFRGEDEVASVAEMADYDAARIDFEARCHQLASTGWVQYKGTMETFRGKS
jgi:hypothetical protein